MFYIVCYDTPSNKRRRKLHSMLKNYAVSVQKSVFETFLELPRFEEMMKKIKGMMDSGVDSVRVYSMTKDAQRRMRVIGMPGLLEDFDHILINESRPEMKPECLSLEDESESDDFMA